MQIVDEKSGIEFEIELPEECQWFISSGGKEKYFNAMTIPLEQRKCVRYKVEMIRKYLVDISQLLSSN